MAYRQPWSLVGPKHNDQYTGGHTGVTTEDVVRAVLPAGTFTCRGLTYRVINLISNQLIHRSGVSDVRKIII